VILTGEATVPSEGGCSFRPRCSLAQLKCRQDAPVLQPVGNNGHASACFRSNDVAAELGDGGFAEAMAPALNPTPHRSSPAATERTP
jgi:hypothetical protein